MAVLKIDIQVPGARFAPLVPAAPSSDALSALDINVSTLPMTPERIFRLLEKARADKKGSKQ